jgi:hypothetical protein
MPSKRQKPHGYDSRGFIYIDSTRSCYLIPLKSVASALGISYKTARNQLCEKRFPLAPFYVGTGRGRPFFDYAKVLDLLVQRIITNSDEKPKRGRPTDAHRVPSIKSALR